MRAFQYMKIDLNRIWSQFFLILLMGAMAYWMSYKDETFLTTGIFYLTFAATIMEGGIFNYELKPETGFLNLLPGTDGERVTGRFFTGMFMILVSDALAVVIAIILNMQNRLDIQYLPEMIVGAMGVGFGYMALQNLLFYIIGKGNNQKWMQMVHLLPGFLLWTGLLAIGGIFTDGQENGTAGIVKAILWMQEHSVGLCLGVLLAGIGLNVVGIGVTAMIVKKRDYA